MAKALKCAALAVLAASSAEAFTGSAFTGMTPKLRTSAVSTRAAATVGPDMSLVLVTGASRGIGKAIALELGKRGANVVVNYAGSKDAAEAVAKEIEGMGVKAMAVKADTSNPDEVNAMFKTVADNFDEPISALINNAGITRDTLVLRMKYEDWKAVIDVNLAGVFLCSQQAAKVMLKKRTGRIINISSVVGQIGNPGQANYAAAKGGVIGMTMSNAKEFAARGVVVNTVCPGFIETDMTDTLPEDYLKKVSEGIPLKRLGKPEEVSSMCKFLALDPAVNYITGHTFNVDGGIAMGC